MCRTLCFLTGLVFDVAEFSGLGAGCCWGACVDSGCGVFADSGSARRSAHVVPCLLSNASAWRIALSASASYLLLVKLSSLTS